MPEHDGYRCVVIVTGGRDYANANVVDRALGYCHRTRPITRLVAGSMRGLDRLAITWASRHGIPTDIYFADWGRLGRAAGPVRNKLMREREQPNLVLSFPGGAGTYDMTMHAVREGFTVYKVMDDRLRLLRPEAFGFATNTYGHQPNISA